MRVPSGAVYEGIDLDLLRKMDKFGFVRRSDQPFTLKSGIQSHVYVFGREDFTDNPEFQWAVGRKIARTIYAHTDADEGRQICLIGIPTAGSAFAQAGSMASIEESKLGLWTAQPIAHRVLREQLKEHGAHRSWVNGSANHTGQRYWLVDNVATDGQSKVEAAEKLKVSGYPVRPPCLIWIDRQQGAEARLSKLGFEVVVVYNLLDITYAFGELGLWPKSDIRAVEEEIKAHQISV